MTPAVAYRRLNKLLWYGRLPQATIVLVNNDTIPQDYGLTFDSEDGLPKPLIILNERLRTRWGKVLVHEMLHVAEPLLHHGSAFDHLWGLYWRTARRRIKGLR